MKKLYLFVFIVIWNSCVDRFPYNAPEVTGTLIVDGYISDQPGPYRVHLFTLAKTTDVLNFGQVVTAKEVILFDEDGNSEVMKNQGDGIYATDSAGITGIVGKKYHIRIELGGGTIFETEPDEMMPAGTIDSVYYEYESFTPISGPNQNGFRIYMDATASSTIDYARWRYTGTFSLRTYPDLNWSYSNCPKYGQPEPLPCSGAIWRGGILQYVSPCTCCISYISQPEGIPHLNDNIIATVGTYKHEELGYVDLDPYVFSENKYMLKVEYMSLSPNAYEYWKVLRDQKQGASSLFQPAYGKLKTNVSSINSSTEAGGFFYSTSIHSKVSFLSVNGSSIKIPQYKTQPPETNCGLHSTGEQLFIHSSIIAPPEWDCDTCTHYFAN